MPAPYFALESLFSSNRTLPPLLLSVENLKQLMFISSKRQRRKMNTSGSSRSTTYSCSRCVMCLCMSKHVSACVYTYVWWAVCFKIVDSKNAVCVPTNRDYIDSMVNKIDSICATFNLIIHGGENQLNFMKIELIRIDLCHVRLDHPRWRKLTRFAQWRKPT